EGTIDPSCLREYSNGVAFNTLNHKSAWSMFCIEKNDTLIPYDFLKVINTGFFFLFSDAKLVMQSDSFLYRINSYGEINKIKAPHPYSFYFFNVLNKRTQIFENYVIGYNLKDNGMNALDENGNTHSINLPFKNNRNYINVTYSLNHKLYIICNKYTYIYN